MRSDPRTGLRISLLVAAAAVLWLLGQWAAAEALWPIFGYASHAITLLAIFLLLSAVAASFLFVRYARVKADLLAGRNVLARWHVDAGALKRFAGTALARDRAEKRTALAVMLVFVILVFGAFGLFDPAAAPGMFAIAGMLAVVVTIAYIIGQRVERTHLEMRSGEVIVGNDGLLFNDVLHVWSTFFSWLVDVSVDRGALTVTYAYPMRFGIQVVSVQVPVPADCAVRAAGAARTLRDRRKPHRKTS